MFATPTAPGSRELSTDCQRGVALATSPAAPADGFLSVDVQKDIQEMRTKRGPGDDRLVDTTL
jgi:hypothetical protein